MKLQDGECIYYDSEYSRYRKGRIAGKGKVVTQEMKLICVPYETEVLDECRDLQKTNS